MGPEYLALLATVIASSVTGGVWTANKILNRFYEKIRDLNRIIDLQENRVNSVEHQVNRLPLEYVLKVDFLREIQEMQDHFKQINIKLDKLMEKLLTK